MKATTFRAFALSAFALLESCSLVAARPSTYLPYELYDYAELSNANQRYWLLNPTENAPKDTKPVLFGAVRKTMPSNDKSNNGSYEVDIQFPVVTHEKFLDTSVTKQRNIVNLPLSSKPVLTDKHLSEILMQYSQQAATVQRQQKPPTFTPDNSADAGLSHNFGNVGILIGKKVGAPIGIVIGTVIGTGIGYEIGYYIGDYVGGPIGQFIGSALGRGVGAVMASNPP